MLIKTKDNKGNFKTLDVSKYLYCTSSSVKVSNNITELNGKTGSVLANTDARVGSRSFSIQGNFEALSLQKVEAFRGEVFASLFAKELFLFLDDDEENENGSYYCVVLDGNVNTTYNQGWNVGKVFTLSFTLVSFLPYLYKNKIEKNFYGYDSPSKMNIYYKGSVPTFPTITFFFHVDIIIEAKDIPLLKNKDAEICLNKDIEIKAGQRLIIKNGLCLIGDKVYLEYDFSLFKKEAVLNPLMLHPYLNTLNLDIQAIKNFPKKDIARGYYISISYNEIYY